MFPVHPNGKHKNLFPQSQCFLNNVSWFVESFSFHEIFIDIVPLSSEWLSLLSAFTLDVNTVNKLSARSFGTILVKNKQLLGIDGIRVLLGAIPFSK